MKKYSGIFWIIGLCAFVAFMCSGLVWFLELIKVSWAFLSTIKSYANLILMISAFIAGWLWLSTSIKNKNVRLVLQIIFIIFLVLSLCGHFGLGI